VDGSDLRKPHARAMEGLQEVKPLRGNGTIPGYRTINAIGLGKRRRGLLYHRLFSSAAVGFLSESDETQRALTSLGTALQPLANVRIAVHPGDLAKQSIVASIDRTLKAFASNRVVSRYSALLA